MEKIKKFLTNIFVMPIRNREKRHKIRRYILDFHLIDCLYFYQFFTNSVCENTILLVETNNCHGEVIGGYISYFQKLGFRVDIIVSNEIQKEFPFCRQQLKRTRIFYFGYVVLEWVLKLKKMFYHY